MPQAKALAYVYFEDELGRRMTMKRLTRDKARRLAVNIAKCRHCWARSCGTRTATKRLVLCGRAVLSLYVRRPGRFPILSHRPAGLFGFRLDGPILPSSPRAD
jgi:hypothetical protein